MPREREEEHIKQGRNSGHSVEVYVDVLEGGDNFLNINIEKIDI